MEDLTLELRLRKLEARVRQLETRAGIAPFADASIGVTPAYSAPQPVVPAPTALAAIPRPDAPIAPPRPIPPKLIIAPARAEHSRAADDVPNSVVPAIAFEQTIGLKWAGWIGAVVLIIAGVLGVKFAYDNGWLGGLPPTARLGMIVAAGFGLIAAGEVVFRKVHQVPAASLYGTGIATLFVAAYVGNAYFHLYGSTSTQLAMIGATLVGALIAMRGNLVSIGLLALIGGNLAPLIVGERATPVGSFLLYLLMLQVVALVLTAFGRGGKWWLLRGVSLGTTALWIGTLLDGGERSGALFTALLFSAVTYQGELIWTLIRRHRQGQSIPSSRGSVFSLFVTAALAGGGLWYLDAATRAARAEWILALAAVSVAVGFVLPRWREVLATIGLAYRFAAATLLILVVPVAFDGDSALVGWTALSLALAAFAFVTASKVSRIAGVATWLLGVTYAAWLIVNMPMDYHRGAEFLPFTSHVLGMGIRAHGLSSLCLTIAGYDVARLIGWPRSQSAERRSPAFEGLAQALAIAATVATSAAATLLIEPTPATLLLVGLAWLLLLADMLLRPLHATRNALILLAVSAVRFVVTDIAHWMRDGLAIPADALPLVNSHCLIGLTIGGSLVGLYAWRREHLLDGLIDATRGARLAFVRRELLTFAAALLTWTLTLEATHLVDWMGFTHEPAFHLKSVACTIAWTLGLMAAELLRRDKRPPSGGVQTVLLLLVVKYLGFDTIGWRISEWPMTLPFAQLLEMISAGLITGALWLLRRRYPADPTHRSARITLGLLAVLTTLWAGSMEIDRMILGEPARIDFADPHLAQLAALSIFWAAFAVIAVGVGFIRRTPPLRYFGLALLGVTLLKVVLLDMQSAARGYRILSFLGLGVVLIGTSIVYGKVSPRLREIAEVV